MSPPIPSYQVEQARAFSREVLVSVVAALIVSLVGGSASMYVTYRVMEHRIATIEAKQARIEQDVSSNKDVAENAIRDLVGKLGDVRADVSWIRGKLEGGKQ